RRGRSRHSSIPPAIERGIIKRPLFIGLTALFGVSMLAACGSAYNSASDVKDANAAFCADLTTYAASLTSFASLDPTAATKADYEAAARDAQSARAALT